MDTITVIDIGSEKIAVATATVEEGVNPHVIGFSAEKSKGIKKSHIIDINEATKTLEKAINNTERMAGNRINRATIVIGGPNIMSLNSHGVVAVNYQTNDIQQEDIERVVDSAKAVSLAANREIIHVLPQEFTVDGQGEIKNPVGMNGVRLEVETHIITASAISLNNIRKVCGLLGIDIEGFVFSGIASAQANLTETEKELGCAMLDIGAGTTDICIFSDSSVIHTAVVPVGSRNVTNDISAGLRISIESSEKLKRFLFDYEKKQEEKDEDEEDINIASLRLSERITTVQKKELIQGIIYPRIDELVELVEKELKHSDILAKIPSGIIISGGGAGTPYLVARLKQSFSLPVRIGVPHVLGGIADELHTPEYSALVGALLYTKDIKEPRQSFAFPELPNVFGKMEVKENFNKLVDFFKNFIPGSK